jgi:spore maturation protein CgeB
VNIFGVALAEEVFAAAASLNIMRSQNIGAHNMRTFEIPAMGGLLLTTRSEEQEEYFPEGRACLMFEGNEELKERIEWIISNPEHAMKIRKNGRENVVHHTYQARALTVLNEIRTLRGERRAR